MYKKSFFIKTYLVFSLILLGCGSTISTFDQYAYIQATSIKVDALNVMDLSSDDFASHKKEVSAVQTEMQKAYEYEKNRAKNTITTTMWQTMMDPKQKLFGGFIAFWEQHNQNGKKLDTAFINNEKKTIGEAFDQIAQLESKKIKNK